ncbi:MAG: imidazole glycerol phosphate synthase subunit HisH [Candidatus Methylacidiphilales bacterium]|nr:imidazole glycerol phosphate synthase subunit HisH [Candidatus Methylacidiphilales bacterium]
MKVGLIDYGRGNLHSVTKALARVGCQVSRVSRSDEFSTCEGLVLPGVGAFGDAMNALDRQDLRAPIVDWLASGKPFLGICLGYQLMFAEGEESPGVRGLGWLPGQVVLFPPSVGKIPHMGWNRVTFREASGLAPAGGSDYFYHVHSFYPDAVADGDTACTTTYGGVTFASGIRRGAVAGFQFHPEKSQAAGLALLNAYFESVGAGVPA